MSDSSDDEYEWQYYKEGEWLTLLRQDKIERNYNNYLDNSNCHIMIMNVLIEFENYGKACRKNMACLCYNREIIEVRCEIDFDEMTLSTKDYYDRGTYKRDPKIFHFNLRRVML